MSHPSPPGSPYGPMALGPSSPASLSCRGLDRCIPLFSVLQRVHLQTIRKQTSPTKVRPDDDYKTQKNNCRAKLHEITVFSFHALSSLLYLLAVMLPSDFPRVKHPTMNMLTACIQQPRLSMTRKRHFARDWCKFSSRTHDMQMTKKTKHDNNIYQPPKQQKKHNIKEKKNMVASTIPYGGYI